METQLPKKKKHEEMILEAKNFFDAYKKQIMATKTGDKVIRVSFELLAEFSPTLSESMLEAPQDALSILETALDETNLVKNPRVRVLDLPKTAYVKIREIRAKHLDKMIWIEGIVRQASEVRPQVVNARFECPNCGAILSVLQIDKKFHEPSRCTCGWKSSFKVVSKEMVDAQRVVIEESPDTLEGGAQPRRINVFLQEDLVEPKMEDRTTPGAKIRIYGILKEVPVPLPTGIATRYDIAVEANNIIPLEESFEDLETTDEDIKQILELAADPNLFKRLSTSIAPSVYGHNYVKESILLQLFGGVKKIKSDGGATRGDVHILLVGDPGVAKSVVLKFASTIAPKGRYVSGKSATAAGLTAAVVKDEFLKGWSLEAGAMVLSNKGTVCIDEIEKMDEHDRSAMHEAMEQQCYLPDLEVTFNDGSKEKISNFVDSIMSKNENKIQQGINCEILPIEFEKQILTTDFETIYPSKISKVSRHIAPDKFVKITLANGREITVTPEHPCWITKNSSITTTPAKSLKTGEFFPIPSEIPIEGREQQFGILPYKNGPALCKLLGYHITDGSYELNRGKKNGIQFCNTNKTLIEDYKQAIKSIFDIKAGITKRNNRLSVRVVSKRVVEFFNSLDKGLLEKGLFKKIPDSIMKCRKDDLALLLRAMFDGDGTVVNVKRGGCKIGLVTENKYLAEQVSELLLRFGIISSIYKDKKVFRLDISSFENLVKFHNNIGFLSERKLRRLKDYISSQKTYRSVTDIIPDVTQTIRSIFKTTKINIERDLGNQICMDCEKHRPFLQKMIKIAENKIDKIMINREKLKQTSNMQDLGKIRTELGLSKLSISKKLGISNYMLIKKEKQNDNNAKYQKLLLNEINSMLSILPNLKELKKIAFGKIRWSKIKKIEILPNPGIKWVYDITINSTHSFISNNMILHNSVTISKANIHASLRAETTVLAAGNPKLGRFDTYAPITTQIDISPALLSRFDILFVLRDIPNKANDEAIASHVLEEHKQDVVRDIVDQKLMRKYIAYARQKIKPKLSEEAVEEIKDFYVKLRNQSGKADSSGIKPIAITARQLEGIIRLSEAHAKMRLSDEVRREDAKRAIELLKHSLSQVGYDEETKTYDIDKITTGLSSSKRGKIVLVRETIARLESKLGKLIPVEELQKELGQSVTDTEFEDSLNQLSKSGDIFRPKKGFIQRL
jgi:replicative DNA helicase Mcm